MCGTVGALPTFVAAVIMFFWVYAGQIGVEMNAVPRSQLGHQGSVSPGEGSLVFIYFWGGVSKDFVGGLALDGPMDQGGVNGFYDLLVI